MTLLPAGAASTAAKAYLLRLKSFMSAAQIVAASAAVGARLSPHLRPVTCGLAGISFHLLGRGAVDRDLSLFITLYETRADVLVMALMLLFSAVPVCLAFSHLGFLMQSSTGLLCSRTIRVTLYMTTILILFSITSVEQNTILIQPQLGLLGAYYYNGGFTLHVMKASVAIICLSFNQLFFWD